MTATPLADARDHLSEYEADVQRSHNRVTITRYGRPTTVLLVIPTARRPTLFDLLPTEGAEIMSTLQRAGRAIAAAM